MAMPTMVEGERAMDEEVEELELVVVVLVVVEEKVVPLEEVVAVLLEIVSVAVAPEEVAAEVMPDESVAVTLYAPGERDAGTVKAQSNEPFEPTVELSQAAATVPTVTEIVLLLVKPVPVTVPFAPAPTADGAIATLGTTVKVTEPPVELVEEVTPDESVASTVYGLPLAESAGTSNEQVKVPFVVIAESAHATAVLPKATVILPEGVNPCPMTVSLLPTAAEDEVIPILASLVVEDELAEDVVVDELLVWAYAEVSPPRERSPMSISGTTSAATHRAPATLWRSRTSFKTLNPLPIERSVCTSASKPCKPLGSLFARKSLFS